MPRLIRTLTVVILPVVTLLLGLQIGTEYQLRKVEGMQRELEFLYSGKAGSGQLVSNPEEEVDIGILWAVWRLLLKHYIEPGELNVTPMVFGATSGLVRAIGDPYTVFMTPTENEEFHDSMEGKLQGIGAELTMRDEQVTIVAPLKGSPAERAGLEPEDVIMEVDGIDIHGEALHQVVTRIRGKKGTQVTLKIFRSGEDELLTFVIVREDIKIPSVEDEVIETGSGSVGYIALNQFGDTSIQEVTEAVERLKKEDIDGLILDLRYNGGGLLEGAVELVSMFLRQGKVVSVERRDEKSENHYVYGRPILPDMPLAILINEGSASASEIVAGALQDHKRALIIGKKSFGKGTVQEVIELPGGSSLRVTTAQWLTANGQNLGKEGVKPDIDIDRTREDREAEKDPQKDAAIEWLLDGEDITTGKKITVSSSIDSTEVPSVR